MAEEGRGQGGEGKGWVPHCAEQASVLQGSQAAIPPFAGRGKGARAQLRPAQSRHTAQGQSRPPKPAWELGQSDRCSLNREGELKPPERLGSQFCDKLALRGVQTDGGGKAAVNPRAVTGQGTSRFRGTGVSVLWGSVSLPHHGRGVAQGLSEQIRTSHSLAHSPAKAGDASGLEPLAAPAQRSLGQEAEELPASGREPNPQLPVKYLCPVRNSFTAA